MPEEITICRFESPLSGDNWEFSLDMSGLQDYVLVYRNTIRIAKAHYTDPWFKLPAEIESSQWDGAEDAYDAVRAATISAMYVWGIEVG